MVVMCQRWLQLLTDYFNYYSSTKELYTAAHKMKSMSKDMVDINFEIPEKKRQLYRYVSL